MKAFGVKRYDDIYLDGINTSLLEVTCPRSSCKGKFLVGLGWRFLAMRQNEQGDRFQCRPCPWCFRVSKLPPPPKKRKPRRKAARA